MNRLPRSIIALILASFCYVANGQLSLGVEALDHEFWVSVKDSGDPKEFQEYLKVFPEGFFAGLAKIKIKRLKSKKALTGQESGVVRKLKNDLKSLDKALVRARAEISKLTEEKTALLITQQELKDQVGQVESLERTREALQDAIAALAIEHELLVSAHKEELDILRERHSDLEVQYNRLVRPARSTIGRFVVEVRFWKEGDVRRYSLRPLAGIETSFSESELHQQLTALKARHADKLYTMVIPDDNSLTHGEAWSFTEKILNRYDYYYSN